VVRAHPTVPPQQAPRQARQIATGALATMVGSIVLARAVGIGQLSDEILAAGRNTAGDHIRKPQRKKEKASRRDKS
jgi:TetR/AcrR family transcriptional repressor of nem operon